ncbi:MAG: PAS domain S-box protein, partial [Gammaproteobacteria bacterium]|nr:PAS domain S-box protein [Gammaproteobacteria bacterium]
MQQQTRPEGVPFRTAPLQSQLSNRRKRLLLLLALTPLAVLGYAVEIPLLFGVNILFGSIAALLALMWLGPVTGILIAAIGSTATWLFWGQPEAILPFVAEIAVIGWLRHRAQRRDPRPPPLAVLATLYWLVAGIPLVLVIYGLVLGLDWPAAWLISIKHTLNGILNAAIAGLITLTVASLRNGRHNVTFGRILFNVLVLALLVPTLLFAAWQDRIIKQQLETEYALRAKLVGTSLAQALAERIRTDEIGAADREATLAGLDQVLRAQLPANWAPRIALAEPSGSEAEGPGGPITRATEVEGLFIARPEQPGSAPLRLWRQAVYQIRLPVPLLPDETQALTLSFSADPLIDDLRRHTLVVLAALLGLTLLGIAIAARLSTWLTKPIRQLVQATQQLPDAIAGSHILPRLPPMSVSETEELAKNMTGMAESLCASFEQLEREKHRQGQQQAIAELQARLFSLLIAHETDEATFADALCDEVEGLLPGYACLLVRQTANEGLKPLGAAARKADPIRSSVSSLLEQPGLIQSCREALRSGALQSLDLDAAEFGTHGHADSVPGLGLVLPVANDTAVLIAFDQHAGAAGEHDGSEPDRGFARQLLEVAAGLAGVAFEALQLRHRHQVLIDALSQAQTGVVITERTDGDDLISYVNSGFTAMTGYQPDEAIGRNCRFLQAEDRFQEARAQLGTATQQGDACSVILRNYRKDGSLFWNSLHISPMRDRDGELTHYIAVQQDVTEAIETLEQLRVSEAQLRDAEARYRLMIENVGDLIVRMDTEGRFEFVSPSYCETFGKTEDELIGSAFMPLVHPDDRAAAAAAMEALRSPPYRCTIEQRAQTIHGWRWFQWSETAVLDDCAEIAGVIGVGRDITERKQAESALAEREAMVSELLALATGFVRVSDETLDATIDQALARVGEFVRADRAYLFRLDPRASTVTNSHEWTAEDIASMLERNLDVPLADFPMMLKALDAGEPVSIEQVAELDDDWAAERRLLEGQQVQSLLLAPVRLEEELFGFVGIETTRQPRRWTTVEIHFLQLFANIFAASEQRSRSIAALKQSNDRYDALARQSRTIAWELDTQGRFTYISDVCKSVIGLPPDAILGRHYTSLIVEQEQPGRTARAADVLAEHQPFQDFVAPYRSSTGELVWLSTDGAPILSPGGQFIGYRGITKDVTDRQLTLKRLARSEARMSAIFNNAPIGIALIGHDRRPLMVNRAMVKLLGRSAETLVRMRFEEFTHPNDQQSDIQAFEELLAGQRATYRLTKRYLRADGEVIWCDLRVSLLPETPGGRAIPLAMIENTT